VTPGPVTSEAIFLNREEVQLYPVYRDPVHDFGLYRYDPSKLRFIKPPVAAAVPGRRADRPRDPRHRQQRGRAAVDPRRHDRAARPRGAPEYGLGKYNDFNTFYLQAASGTSGGSSGSPVIDIEGRVVALNAGGATGAASSFYLPLGRVKRAVELIRAGKPVTRGTLQTSSATRRTTSCAGSACVPRRGIAAQGVPAAHRHARRQRGAAGFAGLRHAAAGDILVKLDGKPIGGFEPLEETLLDASIGRTSRWKCSAAASVVTAQLTVGDLHAITPAAYLEFGDAVVHTLSYQQARHFNLPIRGVYVANPGYVLGSAGVPRGALITNVNSKPVADLAAFREA
jgi:pro-apoptotic serine protease NMA111